MKDLLPRPGLSTKPKYQLLVQTVILTVCNLNTLHRSVTNKKKKKSILLVKPTRYAQSSQPSDFKWQHIKDREFLVYLRRGKHKAKTIYFSSETENLVFTAWIFLNLEEVSYSDLTGH